MSHLNEPVLSLTALSLTMKWKWDLNQRQKFAGFVDVEIVSMGGTSISKCRQDNVLHVPGFDYSLISVTTTDKKRVFTTLEKVTVGLSKAIEMF